MTKVSQIRKRKRGGKASAIRLQVGVKFDKLVKPTHKFLTAVIHEWAEKGETPEGIEIVTVAWKHPNKRWKTESAEDVRERLGRLLRAVPFRVQHVRRGERVCKTKHQLP